MSYSHATERKIRIIEEQLGPDWLVNGGGKSIDAIYNELMGDVRKTLFCKVKPSTKVILDNMLEHHDTKMADFVEQIILAEWSRHQSRLSLGEKQILEEFVG